MLPELLEFVDERVLQLVERRENDIGEVLADMAEDLLSRVQFGTVGWQIEGMHALWPPHFTTAMTARTVQHHPNLTLAQLVAQMLAPKSSRQVPCMVGSNRKTPVPVVGSTAAYSQSHSYSSCTIHGGRSPSGHQRLRIQVLRPKRPSSKATTRFRVGCLIRFPKFFER
jgi:hypothetical protein